MFAVNYTSPERLWWVLVLVIPLAIHLWRRRYQRVVAWSAMRFLQAAQRQVQQRVRLRRLWLLLLRIAMLGLLIFAIADPSTDYSKFEQYLRRSTGTHHVLLLDTSYSMGAVGKFKGVSASAFELARQRAMKYVQQLPQGDVISLVTIGSRDRPLIGQPVFDRQEIISELAALELTNRSGEALNAITLAAAISERSRAALQDIVMTRYAIFSDFQRDSWHGVTPEKVSRIIGASGKIEYFDCRQPYLHNLAVEDLGVEYPAGPFGNQVALRAQFKNYSPTKSQIVIVTWSIEGRVVQREQITLAPNELVTVRLDDQNLKRGQHQAKVHIAPVTAAQPDSLLADNTRWVVFSTASKFQVLTVAGRYRAEELLATALVPTTSDRWPVQITTINEGELIDQRLVQYDMIALCNVKQISSAEMDQLHAYVTNGGTLFLCPGDRIDIVNYNRSFAMSSEFGLPLQWQQVVEDFDVQIQLDKTSHAITKLFADNPTNGIEATPISKYVKCVASGADSVQPILILNNGDPLYLLGSVGSGHVFILTTSIDPSQNTDKWSDLGSWPSFLPLVHESLAHVVQLGGNNQNHTTGSVLFEKIDLSRSLDDLQIQVRTPSGQQKPISVVHPRDSQQPESHPLVWSFSETENLGVYSIMSFVDGVPMGSTSHAINLDGQDSHDLLIPVEELFSTESLISNHSLTVNEIPTDDRYDWFATLLLIVLVLGVVEIWAYRNRVPLESHAGEQR
jgi:hypothetical protein